MDRRTYLATGAVVAIAGCTELGGPGEAESDDEPTDQSDDADSNGEESVDYPEMAGTFDDFENPEEWNVAAGSASADDERAYEGSQSVRLTVTGGEGQARIVRELDEPIDCSEVSPGLAAESSHPTAPLIQLIDDDGNRIDYRASVAPDVEMLRASFGIAHVEGEPDLSEITEIQIAYIADESGELWIDDLHFVPRPTDGKVLLQFDGGYETNYTRALPVLEEYGYAATTFINTDRLREDEEAEGDRLTEDQLEELDDAGWTIGSNTANGRILTGLDDDEKEQQIRDAAEWLEDNGYDAEYFSYPTGRYDQRSLELVEEHHDLGFAGRYPAQGYAATSSLCSRVVDPSPEAARTYLDMTAEIGGITSLCYHELGDGSYGSFESAMSHLNELESAGELEVIAPADVEEEYLYQP